MYADICILLRIIYKPTYVSISTLSTYLSFPFRSIILVGIFNLASLWQADLGKTTVRRLAAQIQASKISIEALKAALRSFGVGPHGTTRAELSLQYARTACGRARLSLTGGIAGSNAERALRTRQGDAPGSSKARSLSGGQGPAAPSQKTPEPGEDPARQGVEEAEVLHMLFGMAL